MSNVPLAFPWICLESRNNNNNGNQGLHQHRSSFMNSHTFSVFRQVSTHIVYGQIGFKQFQILGGQLFVEGFLGDLLT